MTRVILINAGPTQWDAEGRLSGNHALPLTSSGREAADILAQTLPPVDAVYCCRANDACDEVAKLVASRFSVRIRDNESLDALALGLWQGLRPEDLLSRFPTVFPQWQESPRGVIPPEGESFDDALARLADASRRIVRRNRGKTVAIVLRPLALQVVAGFLRSEAADTIADHLHNLSIIETIVFDDASIKEL